MEHGLAAKGIKTKQREMTLKEMEEKNLRFWAGKNKTWYLRRYPYPGKFEGGFIVDGVVNELAAFSEGHGDMIDLGYMVYPVELGQDLAEEPFTIYITDEERDFLKSMAGAFLTENEMGFVDVTYFETKKEFDDAIKELEEELTEYYEGHSED